MEEILYAFVPIAAIFAFAAVLILRPLSKRLGEYLELQQQEKSRLRSREGEHEELRQLISSLERRLDLFEQRLDFTESLLAPERPRSLSGPPPEQEG